MNKDTVLASSIGFGLGLVVALALWIGPRVFNRGNPTPPITIQVSNTTPHTPLTIKKPIDKEIFKTNKTRIEGEAEKGLVVITTPLEEFITPLAQSGTFTQLFTLEEGENEVTVASYAPNGDLLETKTISVIYDHFDL